MSTDAPDDLFSDEDGVLYAEQVAPQDGILGLTLRELLIVAAWAVMFITSFFPVGWAPALWAQGISWLLPLGLPTVAVFLIVLRRFSPDGIRRFGSLGIDQFASVAFSVAALWWVQVIWEFVSASVLSDFHRPVWVPWVQLIALLALVAFTVFAPLIPGLREDFHGRLVTLAHRNANPVRPVVVQPRPERPDSGEHRATETVPATAEPSDDEANPASTREPIDELGFDTGVPLTDHASGGALGTVPELGNDYVPGYARSSRGGAAGDDEDAGVGGGHDAAGAAGGPDAAATPAGDTAVMPDVDVAGASSGDQVSQPFWVLAPTERDVFDEQGRPLFRIGPDAWALVLEDRGGAFVVRHDDGRVGYLHDVTDITRG